MVGLYSAPLPDSITLREQGTQALLPSVGEVQGAVAGAAVAGLPTLRLGEQAALSVGAGAITPDAPFVSSELSQLPPTSRLLPPEEANQKYSVEGHLKFDKPVYEDTAALLHDQKLAAAKRADILNRNEGNQWGTGFWTRFLPSLAISALDPLNVAAAFVPVMGEARYAELIAAAGSSAFARAGIRAAVGAAQGAVGTALLQPIEYGLSRAEMNDYTMTEALSNIATGGALGGGLHAFGGAIGDWRRNLIARRLENAGPEARDTLLRSAVAQHLEDRPVDVLPALEANELARGEADLMRARRQGEAPPVSADTIPNGARPPEATVEGAPPLAAEPRVETRAGAPRPDTLTEAAPEAAALRSAEATPPAASTVDIGATVGIWRAVREGEVFAPGESFRTNVTTGRREVFERVPLPETPAQRPGETLEQAQRRVATDLNNVSRETPGAHDPVAIAEAERITREVPANTDEAAVTKMLADAEAEIETLRTPEGTLPPEVENDLKVSKEQGARDEGSAAAMEQAGNCLAERIIS